MSASSAGPGAGHADASAMRRLVKSFARAGVDLGRDGAWWSVRLRADPQGPSAEILLPGDLPLELAAARQLADLAAARHPDGGRVARACATPDFHPGDSGVAIGSVVASSEIILPQAVGTDVNCGMRLHATGLTLDRWLTHKDAIVAGLTGDLLLGTRDIAHRAAALRGGVEGGLPGWVDGLRGGAVGRLRASDLGQLSTDLDATHLGGALDGATVDALPAGFCPPDGVVREDGLGTVGRGNHFVEFQVVEEVLDRRLAWRWGRGDLEPGRVVAMIHSGSRSVGGWVGAWWLTRAREAWPAGVKHPESGLYPLSWASNRELCRAYLSAEATAAHYGWMNRAILGELIRHRIRAAAGDLEVPLIYDLPHNLTLKEGDRWVARKGACPAHADQPVIIPGSMGASSFLLVGGGAARSCCSASHGAGRAVRRIDMGRVGDLGLAGVTCVTLRDERRIEEAPAAYKPIGPVIDAQVAEGAARVVARMRPLLTFKA